MFQGRMDDEHDESKDKKRRTNHTVLERQRRSEQRHLFDKLQTVLKSDPKAPRLRLLSLVSSTSCSARISLSSVMIGHKLQEHYATRKPSKDAFYLIRMSTQCCKSEK